VIVAVTGGTGFIGRHLIARHCARGDLVRYLTRRQSPESLAGAAAFVGDLASPPELLRAFARGADVLYHCAAELRDEAAMRKTNTMGTANLLAATGGEVGRWVQLSSTGVYGRRTHGDVDEDSAVDPANAYETSKAAADKLLCEAAERQNLSCVVVRPSNVYATDMPNRSLFQLVRMIDKGLFFFIGKSGAVANYVHVENVIDALLLCATARMPRTGRAYIVSDHRSLEDLVRIVALELGKAPPRIRLPELLVRGVSRVTRHIPGFPLSPSRVDALTNRTVYRFDRIAAEFGYTNRVSMEAGIAELVRHRKNRPAG
jgi:nucleoside-diphosphate-sugar epimerase